MSETTMKSYRNLLTKMTNELPLKHECEEVDKVCYCTNDTKTTVTSVTVH